jgi:predicted MFS family arabinose efflux permease
MHSPIPAATLETRGSWVVATVALFTLAFSFGAPWVATVALKAIAAEFGGARETPALAGALGWVGVGVGGIVIGRVAERIGVRWTVMFGAAMVCVGLMISSVGGPWKSGSGMAAGAWMGGFLYDWFGYYAPAFVAAIGANLVNLAIVGVLLLRQPAWRHCVFRIA